MNLQLRKAERKKAKLRIGIGGPSGSGKTYSSLLLANGLAPWDKVAIIDTENGSAEFFSDLGPYNVITISDDYAPERYIEAIRMCEQAGIEVVIIDSITHEWDGKGGCLEIVDRLGGKFQDWAKVTPRHKKFIDAILQSRCHVITTVRKKQDYEMTKDQNGKLRVEKVGMKEITREGFEYELTLSFDLDIRHNAKASKDRTKLFMDKPEVIITQEIGRTLFKWANSGKADSENGQITREQADHLQTLIKELEADPAEVNRYLLKTKKAGMWQLTQEQADEVIKAFEAKVEQKRSAKTDAIGAEQEPVLVPLAPEDSPASKLMKSGLAKARASQDDQF